VNMGVSGLVVAQHLSGRAIAYQIFPHMGTVRVLDSAPSESRGLGLVAVGWGGDSECSTGPDRLCR